METPSALAGPRFPYQIFVPFTEKMEAQDDGSLHISGIIGTSERLDLDREIVDYPSAKAAMSDYMNRSKTKRAQGTGPLRFMHQPITSGRVIGWRADDEKKQIAIDIRVTDPVHVKMCENGDLTGVSIGFRRAAKEGNRLYVKRIGEFSIVDDPANPDSGFPDGKNASGDTDRKGLSLVQYAITCLTNLLMLRDAAHFEASSEADASKVPAMADAAVVATAEMTREMFDEEIDEALEDMEEQDVQASGKLFDDLEAAIDGKSATIGATCAGAIRKSARAMQASLTLALKRSKEAPMADEVKVTDPAPAGEVEVTKAESADMTESHKRHAGALVEAHKNLGEALGEHEKSMHPSVHKAFGAVHKAMSGHAAHAAKMLGNKKWAGEAEPVDVTKAVADAVALALAPMQATIDAQAAEITKLSKTPAAAPIPLGGVKPKDEEAEVKKGVTPEMERELTDRARRDPEFGARLFKIQYGAGLASALAPAGGK